MVWIACSLLLALDVLSLLDLHVPAFLHVQCTVACYMYYSRSSYVVDKIGSSRVDLSTERKNKELKALNDFHELRSSLCDKKVCVE